jgi:hypothetical protein
MLTEETVEALLEATEPEIQALSFSVRWGPRYDPEMILEHAVCHLLRHRRQLERWWSASAWAANVSDRP